jgi:uncharacterized protein YdaU (DUF1376 family)
MSNTNSNLPWLKHFPASLVMHTRGMDAKQIGIYVILRDQSWIYGPLPNDREELDSLAGGEDTSYVIKRMFKLDPDGKLYDPKLEQIRAEVLAEYEERRARTAKARKTRWENQNSLSQRSDSTVTAEEVDIEVEEEADAKAEVNVEAKANVFAQAAPNASAVAPAGAGASASAHLSRDLSSGSQSLHKVPPSGAAPPKTATAGSSAGESGGLPKFRLQSGRYVNITAETLAQWKREYPRANFKQIIDTAARSSINEPFADAEAVRGIIVYRAQRACGIAA